jgi:RecA-family ATPase
MKDLLQLFGEITEEAIERKKQEIFVNAKHNTELSRTTRKRRKFDDLKNDLLSKRYTVTGIYIYHNLSGQKEYEVIRFEKPQPDGKPEKIPIPVDIDGYVGLGNKRQIPYKLEQFLVVQSDEIWLTEGEKCCDAVIANMPSSANIICLGFRKASDFKGYENLFANKKVTIFEDNDKTGATNTQNLVEMLKNTAKEITVVKFSEFRDGYDVADYLEDFSWNQLIERIEMSEKWIKPDIEEEMEEIQQLIIEVIEGRKMAQEEWLCQDLIFQNSICIFDAAGGAGKSYLMLQMAVSYIMQESFLVPQFRWNPSRNKKVLYLTNIIENPKTIIANRIFYITEKYEIPPSAAREMVRNLLIVHRKHLFEPDIGKLKPTETYTELAEKIVKENIQIVIVDPISHFFLLDLNANEKIPFVYETIAETGATWILLHHQSKSTMFEKTENTTQRGASALRDNARLRLTMKKREIYKGTVTDLYIEKANFSRYQQHHILLSPQPPFMVVDPKIWPHDELVKMEKELDRKKKNGKRVYEEVIYEDAEFA